MAVVVSIARGHDVWYPFKTIGAAEGPVTTRKRGEGYHLSVVEKGGEAARTRRFGLVWAYRPVSKGRVIAGFPEKAVGRQVRITKTTLALAEAYEKEGGHAPDERALANIRQLGNAMTRRANEPGTPDFHRAAARVETGLAYGRVWDAARPRTDQLARSTTRKRPGRRARRDTGRTRTGGRADRAAGELAHAQEETTDATTRGHGWRLDGRAS